MGRRRERRETREERGKRRECRGGGGGRVGTRMQYNEVQAGVVDVPPIAPPR